MLTRMRVLHEDEIHFTFMDAILSDRSKLKGQCTDVYTVDASHQLHLV